MDKYGKYMPGLAKVTVPVPVIKCSKETGQILVISESCG